MVVFGNIPALAPRGMTAFIVEAKASGFSMGPQYKKVGMHGAANAELISDNVRAPVCNRLVGRRKGMRICPANLDEGEIRYCCPVSRPWSSRFGTGNKLFRGKKAVWES